MEQHFTTLIADSLEGPANVEGNHGEFRIGRYRGKKVKWESSFDKITLKDFEATDFSYEGNYCHLPFRGFANELDYDMRFGEFEAELTKKGFDVSGKQYHCDVEWKVPAAQNIGLKLHGSHTTAKTNIPGVVQVDDNIFSDKRGDGRLVVSASFGDLSVLQ